MHSYGTNSIMLVVVLENEKCGNKTNLSIKLLLQFQKCFWIADLQKWQKARLPVGEVFNSEEVKV